MKWKKKSLGSVTALPFVQCSLSFILGKALKKNFHSETEKINCFFNLSIDRFVHLLLWLWLEWREMEWLGQFGNYPQVNERI